MRYVEYIEQNCELEWSHVKGFMDSGSLVIAPQSRDRLASLVGAEIRTPRGDGKIDWINTERGNLFVRFPDDSTVGYSRDDISLHLLEMPVKA
jgi:hypothetical protein